MRSELFERSRQLSGLAPFLSGKGHMSLSERGSGGVKTYKYRLYFFLRRVVIKPRGNTFLVCGLQEHRRAVMAFDAARCVGNLLMNSFNVSISLAELTVRRAISGVQRIDTAHSNIPPLKFRFIGGVAGRVFQDAARTQAMLGGYDLPQKPQQFDEPCSSSTASRGPSA